jgi:predicted MFS family arabinose efflux permease
MAAGTIGNVLEWYDFSIYGFFAAAIGRTFFPEQEPVSQVLAAFGVFAAGYLMRPLGGIVVGHIGDRYGRTVALSFSVVAMALPTFLVGILPGYATLGLAAPVMLTLLQDPGPVGRRRMHHRLHLPGRAGGTRTARCGGRRRLMRGHGRHAAGLGDGRRLLRPAVAR